MTNRHEGDGPTKFCWVHGKTSKFYTCKDPLFKIVLRLDKFALSAAWNKEDTAAEIFKCNSEVCEVQYRFVPENVT